MKYRLKHKLAWWLRRWANKLEPEVCAPIIEPPITFKGKEYELNPLRVLVDSEQYSGVFHNMQIGAAKAQLVEAVEKLVEVQHQQPGPGGNNRTILQLLILTPKDNVYESTQ